MTVFNVEVRKEVARRVFQMSSHIEATPTDVSGPHKAEMLVPRKMLMLCPRIDIAQEMAGLIVYQPILNSCCIVQHAGDECHKA